MKAGLIPDLENAVENQWQVLEPIRPGEFPMTALARASLQMSLGATPEDTALIDAKSQDLRKETKRFALDVATWNNAHPQMKLLLVVDQFEELVTICHSEQERQQFLHVLSAALTSSQLYIVLTLRSDFEPQFLNSAFPSQWMNARFLLRPMTQDELREVIEKPAAEKVLYFEPPDLVDRLINEVVQMPGALPLLSFTLSQLYLKYLERYGNDRALTESDYFELGGVAGSLTQKATQEYRNLVKLDPAYKHTVRQVMLRMVTVEGGELARRRVPKSELVYESTEENNRVKTVIEGFSAARLLVEGKEIGDQAYVEPAHDALVRGWDKLQQWKNAQQESLVLRQRLTPAANDWQNQKHNSDYLWSSDPRLAVLEKVLKSADGNWLNMLETEFVNQSIQKRHDELKETKERLRISEERRRLAEGRQLAAQSELVRSGGAVQLSVLLAVESMQELLQVDSSSVLEADSALRNGLALLPFSTAHHNAVVNNIVFSPDGEYFATASDDKTAKVWEVSSGKEIIRLPHDDQVTDVAFSPPDGKYVATASNDKTARLWETSTAREVVRISHRNTVISITFSPDGKYLATASYTASYNEIAKLWDVNNSKEIAQFPIKSAALVFSPDSRYLITDAGNGAKLWDVKSRREIDHFFHESPNNRLDGIALSPNGKYLATASDNNTIKLWDISSHKEIATLEHRSVVIAFSPDSKCLITCASFDYQKNVRLWDVKTGTEIVHFPIYSLVNKVAFSPDAKYLATASNDNTARIWNIQSREKIADFYHESGVQKISFSPDGKYLATASFSRDSKYHLATASKDIAGVWDATNSKQITRLSQNSDVSNIAFGCDGRYLTIASKKNFEVWEVGSNQKITFLPYNAKINSIDLSPDGRYIATVSEDETVWLWNVNTDQKIVLLPHKSQVTTVKFSPNGKYLASFGKDKVVQVWEANSGSYLARFQVEFESISPSLSMSLDGRYVAIGSWDDQNAEVWEVNSRKRIFRLPRQYKDRITTIALSPDGQYLVTVCPTHVAGYTGLVYLWQTKSDEQTPQRLDHDESDTQGSLTSIIQFSPDGEYFVTAPSTRIPRMWETKSGREVARYPHDFGPVMAIAFSSDNKYVVTANADRTVKIWDARKGQEIAFIPHDSPVNYESIAFSPDNKYIVTATNDKTVQLSFIRPEDLIAESCRRLNRNLSWNEWRLYFGNDLNQYRRTYPSLPIHPSFITEVVKSKNIEEAIAILRKLLEQNIPSNIDQTVEARRLVAPDLLKKGEALVTEGKIKEAIDAYTKAEQFDPTLKISAYSLCDLCWYGSLDGYAAEVMDACEKAVTLNPDPAQDGRFRDARGVAKVLTGDTKGAISDFQAAAAWYEAEYQRLVGVAKEADQYKSYKLQRQNWINALSAGQNPFTEEEIRLNTLER